METNKSMTTIEVSTEEAQALEALRAKKKRDAELPAYQALVDESVRRHVMRLRQLSEALAQAKEDVYRDFSLLIGAKADLFGVREGQRSNTFRDASSTMRIILGNYVKDAWLDTASEGVALVKEYISSLAGEDEQTATMVAMLLDLLSIDKQGNLQAHKVLQLVNYKDRISDERFATGVDIIQRAYIPELSKQFVRAEYKDDKGAWVSIPLSILEVSRKSAQEGAKAVDTNPGSPQE